jgi:hypothetical protein
MKWDLVTNIGNPIMSKRALKVIAEVEKFEIRRQDTLTQVWRSIELDQFLNVLDIIPYMLEEDDGLKRYCLAAVMCCQWQRVGRIGNMTKLQVDRLGINHNNPATASTKSGWSRNIVKEREAIEQILFGCNNTKMCLLLPLDVYLEVIGQCDIIHVKPGNELFGNANGHCVARSGLDCVFKNTKFIKAKPGNLGTHSCRKGPATYYSRSSCSRGYVNRRGRWRTQKGVVDVYINPTLPYPDAKCAAVLTGSLCPCRYRIKDTATCHSVLPP